MSNARKPWLSSLVLLATGLVAGYMLGGRPSSPAFAGGNDRYGESITASGSIMVQQDNLKIPSPLDAIYHLDYRAARLLGAVPSVRQSASSTDLIDSWAERDLIADFKLNLATGSSPHFQMTTGSLGIQASGLSVLYVFETVSKQVGVYRLTPHSTGANTQPRFDLLQLKSYALPVAAASNR